MGSGRRYTRRMGDGGSFETVTSKVNRRAKGSPMPGVIVITAAGSSARGSIDADEFITKPVRLEDLLAAVKRHATEP